MTLVTFSDNFPDLGITSPNKVIITFSKRTVVETVSDYTFSPQSRT